MRATDVVADPARRRHARRPSRSSTSSRKASASASCPSPPSRSPSSPRRPTAPSSRRPSTASTAARRDRDGRRPHAGPRHRREDPGRGRRRDTGRAARPRTPRRTATRAPAPGRRRPTGRPGEPLVAAILLSDGANSVGEAEPLDAAERAATLGVPIYTIALGTPRAGPGPRPVRPAGHPRCPAGHRDPRADRRDDRRAVVRCPDRGGPEGRLRQPRVARRLHRGAPGSHLRARRRRASCWSSSGPAPRRSGSAGCRNHPVTAWVQGAPMLHRDRRSDPARRPRRRLPADRHRVRPAERRPPPRPRRRRAPNRARSSSMRTWTTATSPRSWSCCAIPRWRSSPSPSMGPGWSTARAAASSPATCSTSSASAGHPVRVRPRERRRRMRDPFPDDWRATADAGYGLDITPQVEIGHAARRRRPDPRRRRLAARRGHHRRARTADQPRGCVRRRPDAAGPDRRHPRDARARSRRRATSTSTACPAAAVEWNAFADPSAVEAVFATDVPISIVPLDATDDVPVPTDLTDRLATDHAAAGADLMYELLLRNPSRLDGAEGQQLWDELAALAVSAPDLVTWEDATVTVEDRGRLATDPAGRPIRYAAAADRPAVEAALLEALRRGGPRATPFELAGEIDGHVGWDRPAPGRSTGTGRRALHDPLPGPDRRPVRGPDRRRAGATHLVRADRLPRDGRPVHRGRGRPTGSSRAGRSPTTGGPGSRSMARSSSRRRPMVRSA